LQEGETFATRYRVEAFVGQGAMGSVYRTLDALSGQPRALKVMSGELTSSPELGAGPDLQRNGREKTNEFDRLNRGA